MYSSNIKATGSYVPNNIVKNGDLAEIVDTSDEWIRTRTGIGERRISLSENTSDMAVKAAKDIIKNGNIDPLQIDIIIIATISSDYAMPSTACLVQGQIGALKAFAFDITAACSGFVYALSVADKFLKSGIYKSALVIGAETLSKTLDWSDRATCVLFGDGAAGVYLERKEQGGILAENLGSDGKGGMALTSGYTEVSNIFNKKERELPSYVSMNGREILKFVTKTLPISINKLMENSHITESDLTYIVLHQANERIIEAVAKKMKIPLQKFYINIFQYGNTSAASIPIALDEMNRKGLLKAKDKIVISGFGAGLTWGSMLIEW